MRTLIGLARLASLLIRSRMRSRYWGWRTATAFGTTRPPRRERLAAVIGYARWMARMRNISR